MAGKNKAARKPVKKSDAGRLLADNRKARYNYEIGETVEAGIILRGSEVKSLRAGAPISRNPTPAQKAARLWLINAYIPPYDPAGRYDSHDPRRKRKLLLHRKQINRLSGLRKQQGITLIPLRLYFNDRGLAKLVISLASGKKQHDKRASEKDRDWKREQGRLMREKG